MNLKILILCAIVALLIGAAIALISSGKVFIEYEYHPGPDPIELG